MSESLELSVVGEDHPSVRDVRTAIEIERRVGRTRIPVEVLECTLVDADERIYKVVVASDEGLPDGHQLTGGRIRRVLTDEGDGLPWRGEILESDAVNRSVYVAVDGEAPSLGSANIQPFDYLTAPYELVTSRRFAALLPRYQQRLAAAAGRATGSVLRSDRAPSAWNTSWGFVWGPPGTGKTYTLGRQVADLLRDPSERVLVVSTTNRATDAAAKELATAAADAGILLDVVRRAGRVARPEAFRPALAAVLPTRDVALLDEIRHVRDALRGATSPRERAQLQHRLKQLERQLPGLRQAAFDDQLRAVVSTLYAALRLVVLEDTIGLFEEGKAPFTTVVIDEAGLVGRAQAAAVAHYAPVQRLVRALVDRLGPDEGLAAGPTRVSGALWNMATLFERSVARFLVDHLADLQVETQHRLGRVYTVDAGAHRHRAPEPRPDLVVFDQGRPLAVLDTKYRDLSATSLPRDIVYQMSVYSLAFGGEEPVPAIVLYAVPDGERPDVGFTLRVAGGRNRRIVLRAVSIARFVASLDRRAEARGLAQQWVTTP